MMNEFLIEEKRIETKSFSHEMFLISKTRLAKFKNLNINCLESNLRSTNDNIKVSGYISSSSKRISEQEKE